MKAVLLSLCQETMIVDISHEVPRWGIREGSYILSCCHKYFPKNTVHLVVIDPGVGTSRRGIVIRSRNYTFVGPDNGVLIPAAQEDGIINIYSIENKDLFLEKVSPTFHGRDIFAPVAARIACGMSPSIVGPEINDPVIPSFSEPVVDKKERVIHCEVMFIDDFGNVATNITSDLLKSIGVDYGSKLKISYGEEEITVSLLPSFGHVEEGEILALINSCNRLELAVNKGNAAGLLKLRVGDRLSVEVIR
ncbi:MAG: hypothetical protein DRJ41_03375 [Thermoprotei archaeon]|nr:MAG: hypothetical protein DRJ41_03375 [Thermoprotei archaeon]